MAPSASIALPLMVILAATATAPAPATSAAAAATTTRLPFSSYLWSGGARRSTAEVHAAPDGHLIAITHSGSAPSTRALGRIEAGVTYTVEVWARGLSAAGNAGTVTASVELAAVGAAGANGKPPPPRVLATTAKMVSAPQLKGKAATDPQDDGANTMLDGNYRIHSGNSVLYQTVDQDPILDPWLSASGADLGGGMAHGLINIPETGLKAAYTTHYVDSSPFRSRIELARARGTAPRYSGPKQAGSDAAGEIYATVLSNLNNNEQPWVIDAHLFNDTATGRLWMTWGGHQIWVTELDPATGRIKGNPASTQFKDHPKGMHHRVLSFVPWKGSPGNIANYPAGGQEAPDSWEGDALSKGHVYMEGGSLYRHGGYYYACGSYGSMGHSYTIRCCRSESPTGPYVDKDGLTCTDYHRSKGRYGASMLLGDEGDQLVPGHPHMWEENGRHFMGYDFRKPKVGGKWGEDMMGIRELHWGEGGWPTIWHPMAVTFRADDHPSSIGQQLVVSLGGGGGAEMNTGGGAALKTTRATWVDDAEQGCGDVDAGWCNEAGAELFAQANGEQASACDAGCRACAATCASGNAGVGGGAGGGSSGPTGPSLSEKLQVAFSGCRLTATALPATTPCACAAARRGRRRVVAAPAPPT